MIILNILVGMRSGVTCKWYMAQVAAYLQHHYGSNILIDSASAYSASAVYHKAIFSIIRP
jgi:ABC-type nitrate/sulfonate/bicarbonate transport system permease component